jgi:pimeloyl-ACP methyl ester carboxylesterase
MIKYQQEVPPVYNLSKIEVPTFLYYGRRDSIITERVGRVPT